MVYSAIPATFFVVCNQFIMTSALIFKDSALPGFKIFFRNILMAGFFS